MLQAEILKPAIDGTLNVLRSCKKNPSLKRVVLTSSSSTARVRGDIDPNIPLDESSWSSVELCKSFEVNTSILWLIFPFYCTCVRSILYDDIT